MRHQEIKIKDLKTWTECDKAVDEIEMDYRNIKGGVNAFHSGYTTELLEGAKKKVSSIERRMESLMDDCEDCD